MAEWLMAVVLKTTVTGNGTGGSNPSPSATLRSMATRRVPTVARQQTSGKGGPQLLSMSFGWQASEAKPRSLSR